MPSRKIGLALVGLALLPLLGFVSMWQFGQSDRAGASLSQDAQPSPSSTNTVGGSRDAKLRLLTQRYLALNEEVSPRIKEGLELAPVEFLNRELEREGVRAITGSCGFLALHQRQIADSVNIPVFVSSLIQVPLVQQMLGRHRKVGVVVANRKALTEDHLKAVGVSDDNLAIAGMEDQPQFSRVILRGEENDLDMTVFEQELFGVVANLLEADPDVGALVLECTDLSHFAPKLHERFDLPVFDLTSLTRMVAATVRRTIA